jgi:tetratricopeptide (TPR) repeat protein
MADEFETWLNQLNDAFVASTTASLDIEESLAIVKRRAITDRKGDSGPDLMLNRATARDAVGDTTSAAATLDAELLLHAGKGDPGAWREILRRYSGVLQLREKLELNVTGLGVGSKQGTRATQIDDLLHRADTALRTALQEEESVRRRKLLAHGAAVMFGTAILGPDRGQWLPSPAQTPAPSNIGMADVKQVEAATRAMRALDYQFGGGACRDAVVAQLSRAQRLLGSSGTDKVRRRLFRALGDLQNLAGWTTLDLGLPDSSRSHFATALEFSKQSGNTSLLSNIMYRIGRVYLHHGDANNALKWFQLGQIAAQYSGSELDIAVLCANEAWAYAMIGDDIQAEKLLDRSRDELARANPNEAPDWARFYNQADMHAMIGTVHTELSGHDPRHAPIAISALEQALARYDDTMHRSQAFTLTMLATAYLRRGDIDHGVQVGRTALTRACSVKSKRVRDRMKPLEIEAARRSSNADCRGLSHLIRQYRNTPAVRG